MASIVGKTIESVTERRLVGRDTFGDYIDWTETTLHFTDGTTQAYAVDNRDVYEPAVEPRECEVCGNDIITDADTGEWVHPFGHNHEGHKGTPADESMLAGR